MKRVDFWFGAFCILAATCSIAAEHYVFPAFLLGVFLLNILDELRKR